MYPLQLFTVIILALASGCQSGSSSSDNQIPDTIHPVDSAFTWTLVNDRETGFVQLVTSDLAIDFSHAIEPALLSSSSFQLSNNRGDRTLISINRDNTNPQQVFISPDWPLKYTTDYRLVATEPLTLVTGEHRQLFTPIHFQTGEDTHPPAVLEILPAENDQAILHTDKFTITLSADVSRESIKEEIFSITDIKNNRAIPFSIGQYGNKVSITPAEKFAFNAVIELAVKNGLVDNLGNISSDKLVFQYQVTEDKFGPEVIAASDERNIDPLTSEYTFTLEFNEPLGGPVWDTSENYLYRFDQNHKKVAVPVKTEINGAKLKITPLAPLKYSEIYHIHTNNTPGNQITDLLGNHSTDKRNSWHIRTIPYENRIDHNLSEISVWHVNTELNRLYLLSNSSRRLRIVDLTNDLVLGDHRLEYQSSGFCLQESEDRLFISNLSGEAIVEYQASTMTRYRDIPWTPETQFYWQHFYDEDLLHCGQDRIYITHTATPSAIHTVALDYPHLQTTLSGITDATNFHLTPDGNLYRWNQTEDSINQSGQLDHYQLTGSHFVKKESSIEYIKRNDNHNDSPITFDANLNTISHGRYVFDANNLKTIVSTLDGPKDLFATSNDQQHATDLVWLYDLPGFTKINDLPIHNADAAFFDAEGDLYIMRYNSLFIVNHTNISPENQP